MNRYKLHHRILTFLNDKYTAKHLENAEKYCFKSEQIAELFKINIFKAEFILFDLKESGSVDFDKHHGFKISDAGIKKQKSMYFLYKHRDHRFNKLKDYLAFTISVLAILSFVLTVFLK